MDTKTEILPFEQLGRQILEICRSETCVKYPFLTKAAWNLVLEEAKSDMQTIGTDGSVLAADPVFLVKSFGKAPEKLKRGYLHILFHCLLLHPFRKKKNSERLWNLACDLEAELFLERVIPWENTVSEGQKTQETFIKLKRKRKTYMEFLERQSLSVDVLYRMLEKEEIPFETEELETLFSFDDHKMWGQEREKRKEAKNRWERILTFTTIGKERQKHRIGATPGNREEELEELYKSRYDYRKFLKKFAFPREEIQLDEDSFDYIFYHYGMEHYGNLPLIEPLEYKEVNRLEELVIAIDTSGSCSRELVQQFLGETYEILSTRENFFRKMKVYIIQCDCCIQDVAVIHCEEDWKEYIKNVKIQGRSGTDFRPVFRFIKKEQEKKELRALKALIYFTDGDGIYPGEKPAYETAFVFVKKNENMKLVPPWAYRLVIN